MDRYIIVIVVLSVLLLFLGYKFWRQKKDIYDFSDRLEQNLDALLSDKEIVAEEDTKESLYGKINEKLTRVSHVWEVRRRGQTGKEINERIGFRYFASDENTSCQSEAVS